MFLCTVRLRAPRQSMNRCLVHGAQGPRGRRGRRPRASLVSPRTAPPRRVRRDGADAARVAYRLCDERRRRRRLAQATAFPTPCGRPVRHERRTRHAPSEAHAGEARRRGRRRGVVDGPGPFEVDDASLGDHGLRDAPGGGVRMKSRRPPGELRFMAAPARGMHVMMAAAASARDLAAARPGDGRVYLGGRVSVLAGDARSGAASFGSLLIAAVPSAPSRADDDVNRGPDKNTARRAGALNG